MIVIDGKDLIVGRVASFAAKKALQGEEIKIINCEKMFITGNRAFMLKDMHRRRMQGTWEKGPFYFRIPDRFVRRMIRGMLPYKTAHGKTSYKKILCYIGFPKELANEKTITIEKASIKKIPNLKYVEVAELSRQMGAKF